MSRKQKLTQATKDRLHQQLIKLGDMMGDGLHHEPDGKWISKEYAKVMRALRIGPKRQNNGTQINGAMQDAVRRIKCSECGGKLRQTRKGSMRARCRNCGSLFQLLKKKKR